MIGKFEAKRKGLYLTLPPSPNSGKVIDLLNEILKGTIPIGYRLQEAGEEGLDLPKPLNADLIAILEGFSARIKVYRIENKGRKPEIIHTDALQKEAGSWVFLNAYELEPNEQALCIIGDPK